MKRNARGHRWYERATGSLSPRRWFRPEPVLHPYESGDFTPMSVECAVGGYEADYENAVIRVDPGRRLTT